MKDHAESIVGRHLANIGPIGRKCVRFRSDVRGDGTGDMQSSKKILNEQGVL